jgi:RNA-directed DNA polymerase
MVILMQTYTNLYTDLCSYDNLKSAFMKARKRKTQKAYIIEFEKNLDENLKRLKYELEIFTYKPAKLKVFIIRDPKTRKISASDFRDRVVHHALCNVIGNIFEKSFIYDSFANQKGKGTHKAIIRFEKFMKIVASEKISLNSREGGNTNCLRINTMLVMC